MGNSGIYFFLSPLRANHYPQVSPWQAAHSIFFMKNQKMPELAINKGLDFWWYKNKAEHSADAENHFLNGD